MGGVFSINKVPINGGESTALMTTSIPIMSLVRDDSSLYWVEWLDGGYDKGSIKKMPPNGGIPTTVYSAGNQSIVYGVMAVSGGEIVFGDIDLTQSRWRLMKVSISGGPATVLVDAISEEPTRIIIDGSSVYWADAHSVNTIPLSGGERIVLADSLGGPLDLAVVAENLFWTENYENPGSIKKVPITGDRSPLWWMNLICHCVSPQMDPISISWRIFQARRALTWMAELQECLRMEESLRRC